MIHPDTRLEFINVTIGSGVIATSFIPKGTITYVKDPLEVEIGPARFMKLSPQLKDVVDKYSYIDDKGKKILSWDLGKYVNHCCTPNTMSTGWGFEIAIRDIQPGEEITDEYGLFNLEEGFQVSCTKGNCRKVVSPGDLDKYYAQWDEKVKEALKHYALVEQPLLSYLDGKTAKNLLLYINGKARYKSVLALKYTPKAPGGGKKAK